MHTPTAHKPLALAPRLRSTPPWLAGLWGIAYLALAALHLVRDTAPPWTPTPASVLGSLSSASVSAGICVIAAIVLAALAIASTDVVADEGAAARVVGVVLVSAGLGVALVLADARALTLIGYLPMIVLGLVGIGPADDIGSGVLGGSLLAVGSSVGGMATVATGVATMARTQHRVTTRRWTGGSAVRVGRVAAAVAVVVPLFYAMTRLAWALGYPFGVRDAFLVELGDGRYAGLGLALAALTGCLLTLGLVMRWGEVFWTWLPRLGGTRVPVGMAVFPALFVAAIVTSAGLAFLRLWFIDDISALPGGEADWATWLPEMLWPVWGVALAVAALAYQRRRGRSGTLGTGECAVAGGNAAPVSSLQS